jgi:hypothetical protein
MVVLAHAIDLAGDAVIIDLDTLDWHLIAPAGFSYRDRRWPDRDFVVGWSAILPDGRSFLAGAHGWERWWSMNMGRIRCDVVEVTQPEAAAMMLNLGVALPSQLASVVVNDCVANATASQAAGDDPLGIRPADPLTETLDLIPKSFALTALITFLHEQPGRSAKLLDACKKVYRARDKSSAAKTRKLITRNEPILDLRNAPLRLLFDKKTGTVHLLNRDGA